MDASVREPRQNRSRQSLEKVLEAGVNVLAEKGYDGFSIADVSQQSGVSVGSIYQRFQSKAVLFAALQERILERIDREQDAMFDGIDASALSDGSIVDAAVKAVADQFQRHEPSHHDPDASGCSDRFGRQLLRAGRPALPNRRYG